MNFNYIIIIFFIIIDIFNINKLFNLNYTKLVFNHINKNIYDKNKVPEIYKNIKLNKNHLNYLNNLKYPNINKSNETLNPFISKFFGGNYSKKSSVFLKDFDIKIQNKLIKISNYYKPYLEQLINKKLYLTNSKYKIYFLRLTNELVF